MAGDTDFPANNPEPHFFQIRLEGYLDPSCADLFDGWTIRHEGEEIVLYGSVRDQATILDTLFRLQNLGLNLLSLIGTRQ